jgi:hypothetical protein
MKTYKIFKITTQSGRKYTYTVNKSRSLEDLGLELSALRTLGGTFTVKNSSKKEVLLSGYQIETILGVK